MSQEATMIQVGVILSGCGFLDGAEIHEAVSTLLALDRAGATWVAFAPDVAQADVVDHAASTPESGARNVLRESARIVRGEIEPTTALDMAKLDALVLPGGFGAAKNLCDFATAGPAARVRPEIQAALRDAHRRGKPIGAICIAPALVAASFRGTDVHPELTIGDDPETARALVSMGAIHRTCDVRSVVVDRKNRIVSTPAYMLARRISEAAEGIEKLVAEVLRLAGGQRSSEGSSKGSSEGASDRAGAGRR